MKKYKIVMYYRQQKIKTIYTKEIEKALEKIYVITVYFKKHIFATIKAGIVVVPTAVKYNDENNKTIHIEVKLFEGVAIK